MKKSPYAESYLGHLPPPKGRSKKPAPLTRPLLIKRSADGSDVFARRINVTSERSALVRSW